VQSIARRESWIVPEIQGLRGIAVLGVLLFHANLNWPSGGFLGVDVFFVISGFVISGLIQRKIEAGTFSFKDFYISRAWRLFPTLAVTVVLTASVFLILTPTQFNPNLFLSSIYSLLGLSNIYFAGTIDYFAPDVVNPVLHTWSLGVEEQFYLVFPVVLVYILKRKVNLKYSFGFICVVGFAASVFATNSDPQGAFYFSWHRAWEFVAGVMVSFVDRDAISVRVRQFCSWIGAFILALSYVFYAEDYVFPGVGALAPVFGTALLIAGSGVNSLVNSFLKLRPITFIGDISYSLYLAHWGVVCLVSIFIPIVGLKVKALLLLLFLVSGYLLNLLVERRFQAKKSTVNRSSKFQRFFPYFLVAGSVLIIHGVEAFSNSLWEKNEVALNRLVERTDYNSLFRNGVCMMTFRTKFDDFDREKCLGGGGGSKGAYLVVGDSLAANITGALERAYPMSRFMQATSVDYKVGRDEIWPNITRRVNDIVVEEIVNNRNGKIGGLVLFARWTDSDIGPLAEFIEWAADYGLKIYVVGPSPEWFTGAPQLLAYGDVLGIDLGKRMIKKERFDLDQSFKKRLKGLSYFSVMDALCEDGFCPLVKENKSLYFDKVHMTEVGADRLVRSVFQADSFQ